MKLKHLFVISCLFGISFLQLSAQNTNKATQDWYEGAWYALPVYCNDVEVDWIIFPNVRVHWVFKTDKDGNTLWEIDQVKGEGISSYTGKVYKYRELDDFVYTGDGTFAWKYTLIGNKGSHYVGAAEMNLTTGEITLGHAECK